MSFLTFAFGIVWLVQVEVFIMSAKVSFWNALYLTVIGIVLIISGLVIRLRDQKIEELEERLGIKREPLFRIGEAPKKSGVKDE